MLSSLRRIAITCPHGACYPHPCSLQEAYALGHHLLHRSFRVHQYIFVYWVYGTFPIFFYLLLPIPNILLSEAYGGINNITGSWFPSHNWSWKSWVSILHIVLLYSSLSFVFPHMSTPSHSSGHYNEKINTPLMFIFCLVIMLDILDQRSVLLGYDILSIIN